MSDSHLNIFVGQAIRRGLLLCVAAAVLLFVLGQITWAKGLALGGVASGLNFWLMALLLPKAVDPRKRAAWMGPASWALRYSVMGLALGVCVIYPEEFSFLACALGLFAVQLGLMIWQVVFSEKHE